MVRLCALASLVVTGFAAAQVYKWVDKEGRVQYGDRPPDETAAQSVKTPQGGVVLAADEVEIEDTEFRYFEVGGLSIDQLNRARDAFGPDGISIRNGKPYKAWANCGWSMRWHYDTAVNSDGQCRISKFKVKLHVYITFPKWIDKADASPDLQRKWDTFTHVVMTHELGHRQNDIRAANEMAFEMHKILPQKSCGDLDGQVRALSTRLITKYKLLNNAWDQAQVNGSEEDYYLH
jgi:predicted secreted Zn-dependent protease